METKRARDTKTYSDKRNYGYKKNKGESNSIVNNKPSKNTAYTPPNAVILDNGAYSIKVGYAMEHKPVIYPNCIMKAKSEKKRFFIGDQIEDCRDLSGLYYLNSSEKGYISKYDIQKTVWDYTFNKYPITDETVILTQPLFNFKNNQEFTDEVFYEEYECKALYKANATDFANYYYNKVVLKSAVEQPPCLVIDSGHSFTHIVPYINGQKYASAIIRLDIGGKLLTNYLKDIISYRQLHVMEETYVINQVKEDVCYMALDFKAEMQRSRSSDADIVQSYVLPDFHNVRRGYIQQPGDTRELPENCQILRLNNERIMVPELFMKPSIIPGFEEAGLPQLIANCISKCPPKIRSKLSENIVLIGGNFAFKGFKERLEAETRMFLPCEYKLNIYKPDDPLLYAWDGAAKLSKDPKFPEMFVTRKQYEELGSSLTYEKFNSSYERRPRKTKRKEEVAPTTPAPPVVDIPNYMEHLEGIDLFKKMPESPKSDKPEVEFILEGDDIEQYDNQFVTVEITNYPSSFSPNILVPKASIRLTEDGDDDGEEEDKCLKLKQEMNEKRYKRREFKNDGLTVSSDDISEQIKLETIESSSDSSDATMAEQTVMEDESGLNINSAIFKKDDLTKSQTKLKKRNARRNSKTIQPLKTKLELRRGGLNKRKLENKMKVIQQVGSNPFEIASKVGIKSISVNAPTATTTPQNNMPLLKPKLDYKNLKPEDVPLLALSPLSKSLPRIPRIQIDPNKPAASPNNKPPELSCSPLVPPPPPPKITTLYVRPIPDPMTPRIQQHIVIRPIGAQIMPIRGDSRVLMPQPVRTLLQNQQHPGIRFGGPNQSIRFVMQNQTLRIGTQNQTNRHLVQNNQTIRPIIQNHIIRQSVPQNTTRPPIQIQPLRTFNQPIRTVIQSRNGRGLQHNQQPLRTIIHPIRQYNNRQPVCTILQNTPIRPAGQPIRLYGSHVQQQSGRNLRQQTMHNFMPQTTSHTEVYTIDNTTCTVTGTTRTVSLGPNQHSGTIVHTVPQNILNNSMVQFLPFNQDIMKKGNSYIIAKKSQPAISTQSNPPPLQSFPSTSYQIQQQLATTSQSTQPIQLSIQPQVSAQPMQYTVQPLLVPQQITLDQIPISIQNNPINTDWSSQ